MSIRTQIDTERHRVIHTVMEDFGLQDIEPAWAAMLADPGFRADMDVIWDFRQVITPKASFDAADMQQIAAMTASHIRQRNAQYKLALVAGRDLYFGLLRMFEAYSSEIPIEIHVFRSMEEASDWIDS